jgi:hypothetical protein
MLRSILRPSFAFSSITRSTTVSTSVRKMATQKQDFLAICEEIGKKYSACDVYPLFHPLSTGEDGMI